MDHQFHYDTETQAQLWLALHDAYSPARRDDDCLKTYARAFQHVAAHFNPLRPLSLVSLGCGGGQKDVALLSAFSNLDDITYVPTDVSLPLALTAHLAAKSKFPALKSQPAVIDFKVNLDFDALIVRNTVRLVAFFGMLPNFEPEEILPRLAGALRPNDRLLISANLAPGYDVERILPQYQNDLTRRWLATVLLDAGINLNPSDIQFRITEQAGLKRIEAGYRFTQRQTIHLDRVEFTFQPGEWFQLFFSYRHTPEVLRDLFSKYQIEIRQQWITASGEEGVFLLSKRQA